jgi:Family of unknown function (DUF6502)
MDAPTQAQKVLEKAVATLLRPLFRLLLRHSMSFLAFEELAKRVFVDVAMKDFAIEGKQPSISRAAILSGLTRKEVSRLLAVPDRGAASEGERYNRAARVLTGWLRDAEFVEPNGMPRMLAEEGEGSFGELVKRYSGDVPVRAVLDELVRVGAVLRRPDGRVELLARAYVPSTSVMDKLAILGADVADLISTIDHNLEPLHSGPRFQRKVMYQRIPVDSLPAFRRLSAMQAQALLERMDRWLEEHDTDETEERPQADALRRPPPGGVRQLGSGPSLTQEGSTAQAARVGLGIYYFEELVGPSSPSGEEP